MRKSILSVLPVLSVVLPLAGCSSNLSLPWEDNFLDPGRIATREPLEIPPDMNVLPGREPPEESLAKGSKVLLQESAQEASVPTSARSILFNTPQANEQKPLTREEQEHLPGWLGSSSRGDK